MDEILDLEGEFTWLWSEVFFIETKKGNFIWLSPEYNGDHTITRTEMTYRDYLLYIDVPYGRSKGKHIIRQYCGDDVEVKKPSC
jgi:hypothetical protein